jgi:FtsP/CotA-like multicopper oxidase with cupredoxin domain
MGDRVIITVTNGLNVPTSLHWHGLFQNRTVEMDGPAGVTQCPIPPNGTYVYDFYTENQEGTYWWYVGILNIQVSPHFRDLVLNIILIGTVTTDCIT